MAGRRGAERSLNPLTAGAAHIRAFIFYQHIKYNI